MTEGQLPLLLFPKPSPVRRQDGSGFPSNVHFPSHLRQIERLPAKFQTLQRAFENRRLELQASALNDDPDLVLVFETVGSIADFISSAERVTGLEWLFSSAESKVTPDEDFFDGDDVEKPLSGKLFLMGSNRQALTEIVRLWDLYKDDSKADLGKGLSAWKGLFAHLKDVRFWSAKDRLSDDLRLIWSEKLAEDQQVFQFEVEAWCFQSAEKNAAASEEIARLVAELQGQVVSDRLLTEIAYHGILVRMPAQSVQQLLADNPATLLESDRVMILRPQGQAVSRPQAIVQKVVDAVVPVQPVNGFPTVAILDGLPLANHPRLQGRLLIEDPDNYAANYPAADRVHGTAMASLVAWGELDSGHPPLPTPIYVHPILQPDASSNPRVERSPQDRLLIDVIHSAVRRMFEGTGDIGPTAPTVKAINLSIGDKYRPFSGELSPLARLLDWLSYKYSVLFLVSAGNHADDLVLETPRDTLGGLSQLQKSALGTKALLGEDTHRRLISPAESVNALTVGACYSDSSAYAAVPNRHALFSENGVAPYSCIGPGFRRSIKPDFLMPGGRVLHSQSITCPPHETHVNGVWVSSAPGQRTAAPPDAAGSSTYSRGTSNSTALATRGAAHSIEVLNALRENNPESLPESFDAIFIKALLVHGSALGDIHSELLAARPDIDDWMAQRRLLSRYAGYGVANLQKAFVCTEQRATMLGHGELKNNHALEFKVPIPESLSASLERRRLTVTLAWLTPTNPRHSKYRNARLWVDRTGNPLRLDRVATDHRQVQLGTLQHEIFEGDNAVPVVANQDMILRVNCVTDAGRLYEPVKFALCVTLEVAEGVALPIYEQVRQRIQPRVAVRAQAS